MINVWNSNIFSLSCTAIVCLIYNYTWKQQKCYNSSQWNVIGCFFIPFCEERIVLSGSIFLLPCFHSSITLCQSIVWPHLGQMLACLKAALTWLTHLFLCHKLRCDQLEKSVDCYWGKGFWWPLPIFLRNFPVNQWCRSQHCCSKKSCYVLFVKSYCKSTCCWTDVNMITQSFFFNCVEHVNLHQTVFNSTWHTHRAAFVDQLIWWHLFTVLDSIDLCIIGFCFGFMMCYFGVIF